VPCITLSGKTSGANGGNGLDDIPARAPGIDIGIDKNNKPHDLVIFQYAARHIRSAQ